MVKGDTSSDEICSHFYATTLSSNSRRRETRRAGQTASSSASRPHLLDHHWQLIDLDGKPTRWGRWDPDYFATD